MSEALQEITGHSAHLQREPQNSKRNGRAEQLQRLIFQSFQVFNTFGKQPEDLKTVLRAFAQALEGFGTDDITEAFRRWMNDQSAMPTPADIRKIAGEIIRERGSQRSTWRPNVTWIQVIRAHSATHDGEVLAENLPDHHLAPVEIWGKWPGVRTSVSYRRAV